MKNQKNVHFILLRRKLIFKKNNSFIQFFTFSAIGLINTGIHYLIFLVLFSILNFHYLIASSIGYAAGVTNSFFLNRRFTFKSTSLQKKKEFIRFVIINLISLTINLILLKYFVDIIKLKPEFAQLFAIFFSTTINFLGNKFWTFKY